MANTYDEVLKACYELYKTDWEDTHLAEGDREAERRAYEEEMAFAEAEGDDAFAEVYPTFDAWVEENGYGGSLWACLGEFEESEFRNPDYMASILKGGMWTAWLDVSDPGWWPTPTITTEDGWASHK